MTKRILCYGDSNVWGSAGHGRRYETQQQWPLLLQKLLGQDYEVEKDGVCGRPAGNLEANKPYRNGQANFVTALHRSSPLTYVVVALGTNDLKARLNRTTQEVVADLAWYQQQVADFSPEYNLGSPISGTIYVSIANFRFNPENPIDTAGAQAVNGYLKNNHYVNVTDLEHSADGLHYSAADHEKVANRVYEKIKELEHEVQG